MAAFTPCPAAEKVTVPLFGAGPGLYFDFATSSFHVPMRGSGPCATPELPSATAITITDANDLTVFQLILIPAPFLGFSTRRRAEERERSAAHQDASSDQSNIKSEHMVCLPEETMSIAFISAHEVR
jgi:hypothetical protein